MNFLIIFHENYIGAGGGCGVTTGASLSTGQQTPGTKRLLKQMDCLSLVRSSSRDGQLLRSWHLPGPPSAVVHPGGLSLLALGSRSAETSRTLLDASARTSDSVELGLSDDASSSGGSGAAVVVVVVVVVVAITGTGVGCVGDTGDEGGWFAGL